MTKVSVVFTALNEEDYITRLMASLSRQTSKPFEVICVDAGSTDGTERAFNHFCAELSNLKFVIKEGIQDCVALNYAASMVGGDVVLFTGAANAFPSKSIEIITSHFDSEPKLAAIAGKPVIAESAPALLRMEYELWNNMKSLFAWLPHPLKRFVSTSACLAVKTEVFRKMGGFDATYVNNDGIFGIELMRRREKVQYCPELYFFKSSRRYVKVGALKFNQIFFYNAAEDFMPFLSRISWLDSFRDAMHKAHKPVTKPKG